MAVVDIAIFGLPQCGKTTLFGALTHGGAEAFSRGGAPGLRVGVVKVPDPRLGTLAKLFQPQKVTPIELTYWDLPQAREEGATKGIGGQQLNQLQKADALLLVIRAFDDPAVPHVEGSVDPYRDLETMQQELGFSDLAILERRVERLRQGLKGAKPQQREAAAREEALLESIQEGLDQGVPVREQAVQPDPVLANYQFLTAKPLVVVANVGEGAISRLPELVMELHQRYGKPGVDATALCAKLEMELSQLSPEEEREFRVSLNLERSGVEQVVRLSLELLRQVIFFTVVSQEVRAWNITQGTLAVKAAGRIHSDMERGFIRAEVVAFQDLVACGSLPESRRKGLLRTEGKQYPVQDGDVITFLFNV